MTHNNDTIIVGGGLTGLVIAHTIKHNDPGHRLLLLEKDDAESYIEDALKELEQDK